MKPIYKSLVLASMTLQVSLALNAQMYDGENTSDTALPAEILDSLRVELVAPNVSGARDLIKSGECEIDGSDLAITLNAANWIKGATYRVQVVATFGTQTQVIYAMDVNVPYYVALSDIPQEYEDTVTVVSTIGDCDKSGADATVYAKDGDGNAHITKPLNVSGSVQEGSPYGADYELDVVVLTPEQKAEVEAATGTAYDYCATNSPIPYSLNANIAIYTDEECTQKVGNTNKIEYAIAPIAGSFFSLQDGESISAGTYYSRVERKILSGNNSHAEGVGTTASGENSHAEGAITTASGENSHAEGVGTIASQQNQHVCGQYNVEDTNNSFQFIVGNGTDRVNRKNAFAVTKSGELALFEADGTPVILDAATLKALIASLQ